MPNDRYRLGELLGRGGMGQVHAARDGAGRTVAVKRVRNTLAGDPLVLDRLADEARLLCTISHPNVVRALDHGTSRDGMPFLVMDRAHGTPLHQLIGDRGPLPLERLAPITAQLFAGLTAIHDAQIVHADLKSHNVLVDDVDIVTIIDFGLARRIAGAPHLAGMIAGTPAYMAPEVISGAQPNVAADIYAAGTIVYEMLTGTTPFTGHVSTILTRQLSEPIEPPSRRAPARRISAELDAVVLRALDRAPGARFATVAELACAFRAALTGGALAPAPTTGDPSETWLDAPTVQRPASTPTVPYDLDRAELPQVVLLDDPPARSPKGSMSAIPGTPLSGPPGGPPGGADEQLEARISLALAKAQRLIERRSLSDAIDTLETTLAALSVTREANRASDAWRIETVLAALYDTTGRQERARRMALVAYRHALRTGCALAENRAGALLDRLAMGSRRRPRGTGRPR